MNCKDTHQHYKSQVSCGGWQQSAALISKCSLLQGSHLIGGAHLRLRIKEDVRKRGRRKGVSCRCAAIGSLRIGSFSANDCASSLKFKHRCNCPALASSVNLGLCACARCGCLLTQHLPKHTSYTQAAHQQPQDTHQLLKHLSPISQLAVHSRFSAPLHLPRPHLLPGPAAAYGPPPSPPAGLHLLDDLRPQGLLHVTAHGLDLGGQGDKAWGVAGRGGRGDAMSKP